MNEETIAKKFSRRTFMKGMGAGVVGGYAVMPTMEKAANDADDVAGEKREWLSLTVNSQKVRVQIPPQTTLAELLRNRLALTGAKVACNHGECGGCTVLVDGKAIYACHFLALDAADKDVLTIEGLLTGEEIHQLQQSFVDHDGLQCGFCTPGQIMAAYALLQKYPKPTREQVMAGMSGNLCRCAAYPKIIDSVLAMAEKNSWQ